jgi:hypothetical protein
LFLQFVLNNLNSDIVINIQSMAIS